MITFILGVALLIGGYCIYGKVVEKIFVPNDNNFTPAIKYSDNVDYIALNPNKNMLLELINIAGVGPIFGPIMGALYGPAAFLWIVFGCIFAGAVHDYMIGMISVRNKGAHLPKLASKFLGKKFAHVVNLFTILLLLLVGTVFISSPATLIHTLVNQKVSLMAITIAIYIYYILATLLPIDKIIARVYPFFGLLLIISAVSLFFVLIFTKQPIPELTLKNMQPDKTPIFPLLFLTISCGALSGFHATQSPIISRTLTKESDGRRVFYLAMICEGIVAMIWAAAAMSFFGANNYASLAEAINTIGPGGIVSNVAKGLLGPVLGTLAIAGVIVLPISSGDTAFRSARMIIAEYIKLPQQKVLKRLVIALPLFIISIILIGSNFDILWRYFTWANQVMAVIALFTATSYLYIKGKPYLITLIPAIFMSSVIFVYILNAKIGFNLPFNISLILGMILTVVAVFIAQKHNQSLKDLKLNPDGDGA